MQGFQQDLGIVLNFLSVFFKVASKFDYTTGNFVENLYERILYFKIFSDIYTCSCVA